MQSSEAVTWPGTSYSSATGGSAAASATRSPRADVPFVVAEQNRELVERLRDRGVHAVTGDASDPVVLAQAHVARARLLVIATPDTTECAR